MKHTRRVARVLTISVVQNSQRQRLVGELSKHQFVMVTYLLRGMGVKIQRIRETSEPVVIKEPARDTTERDIAEAEWVEQMTPKWMKKEQAKRAREERS